MRRYAFGIVGTALALVVLPCLLLLTVDMEERRIAPLAGRWASVLHPGATADIRRGPECYILTLRRPGEDFRHGRTFRLRYRRGIYYLDAGRRVELYAPTTNRLLLLPGGSYRRITNLKNTTHDGKMNPVVTALRDDIRRRQQVVQHIASLEEQLDSDRICGAWLAAQGTLTASLRRIGTATYRMLVYDHTLCYRRLVQDAVVTLRRHRLLFGEEEDCGANRVEYDPAADRLTLGCYGLFLPDDATHPAAEEFETPVE